MKRFQLFFCAAVLSFTTSIHSQSKDLDLNVLKGTWKLDMSPQDKTDNNFATMKITKIDNSTFKGEFYREGVRIREGRINTQLGIIYGTLISGDNSGEYNTTFYYKNGALHGTTHSVHKDFLAVWIGTKMN
ncbi:hypothetical protein [Winogradskyella jejuensis]|uniref:Lipocalin-like domain-containing protein n=1 Tax=Winogradskyella jejuensis TaxID=1089305 RepID=A0A1M5TAK7_9FLAO|nr:hypothetical protein [Winogradskyella jejuensis]SHH47769.1 hypothetical protein SAMN05444148_2105 [Winogradskyella jejuensis]